MDTNGCLHVFANLSFLFATFPVALVIVTPEAPVLPSSAAPAHYTHNTHTQRMLSLDVNKIV